MIVKFFRKTISFRKDQRGSVSVEAVFAFPMLLWAATALYTFFDIYKAQNATFRANYTISDMLSREKEAIDVNYLNGIYKVYRYMTRADPDNSWIRVSQIQCKNECDDLAFRELEMEWSKSVNGARSMTNDDFTFYNEHIPLLAQSDRLILVETSMLYQPPFSNALVSFPARNLVSQVVTRPRFSPQLIWDDTGYDSSGGGSHDDGEPDTNAS